jgi:hypothetical protein
MARYGRKASQKVKRAMHERKRRTLKSGRSEKRVKSRKPSDRNRAIRGSPGGRKSSTQEIKKIKIAPRLRWLEKGKR